MGKLLTITEVSNRLGLSKTTIKTWISEGTINAKRIHKLDYVDEDSLAFLQDDYIELDKLKKECETQKRAYKEEIERVENERFSFKEECSMERRVINCVVHSGMLDQMICLLGESNEYSKRTIDLLRSVLVYGYTLGEVAKKYHKTRERIRQEVAIAIRRIKLLPKLKDLIKENKVLKDENDALKEAANSLSIEVLNTYKKIYKYEKKNLTPRERKMESKIKDFPKVAKLLKSYDIWDVDKTVSKRVRDSVIKSGLNLGKLISRSPTDMFKIRNCGSKTVSLTRDFLEKYGLDFNFDIALF